MFPVVLLSSLVFAVFFCCLKVTISYDLIEDMYEMLTWNGGELCDGYDGEQEQFYESLLKQKSNSLHWVNFSLTALPFYIGLLQWCKKYFETVLK